MYLLGQCCTYLKEGTVFIQYDVCDFYSSITEELINKSLDYASTFVEISESDRNIILQCKKSFLFDKKQPWCKKGENNFDVGMGSYDGAETCELVGLYMLHLLQETGINLGKYRDDGLGYSQLPQHEVEDKKKDICRIYKDNNLAITINANSKVVNFLDVTLDLGTDCFKPYKKENNKILYINKDSNHPPSIIKNIPPAVNRRLSSIASNEAVFVAETIVNQEALAASGYNHKLKFEPIHNPGGRSRHRGRRRTYFNPPFSVNVETNVAAKFLKIIDSCFPPSNPLHKIFNRNTVKVSYSTMPNMKQTISMHNAKVAREQEQQPQPGCNCRGGRANCPLDGVCLTEGVIYQAKVTRVDNNHVEFYTGGTEQQFKKRYYGHTFDMRHQKQRYSTSLSKYIWELKDQGINYVLEWSIIARGRGFNPTTRSCQICLKEKYCIMFRPEGATLNSREEIFNTCRHRTKLLLSKA